MTESTEIRTGDGALVATHDPVSAMHAALAAFQAAMPTVYKGNTARIPGKDGGPGYCLAPETRVLTADLRHVALGKLGAGDLIAGFDEDGPDRRWRTSTILSHREVTLPCFRVTLSDGTVVTASEGHRWLVSNGQTVRWVTTENLRTTTARNPSRIVRLTHTWEPDDTWTGGYVAGAFDGEGSLCQTPAAGGRHQANLTVAQRDNVLLRTVEAALIGHDFDVRRTTRTSGTHGDVTQIRVYGGRAELMRALGTFQPRRLCLDIDRLGVIRTLSKQGVVSLEPVGEQTVIALRTSTETLVAEGLASHNSYTYADLGDVTAAAMPLLTAHGLAFSCCPRATDKGGYELVGVLTHSAGYAMEGALPLFGNNSQQIGGAITYARRYLLGCMTGIVTDEDDDGASSSGERTQAAPPPYHGPSTADLLTTLDELARANGESYAGVVAPYIKTRGISVDDLEREPARNLHPFVEHIARYYRDNPGKPEGVDDREGASTEGGAST